MSAITSLKPAVVLKPAVSIWTNGTRVIIPLKVDLPVCWWRSKVGLLVQRSVVYAEMSLGRWRPGSRYLSQSLTSPSIWLLVLLSGSINHILVSKLPGNAGRSELWIAGNPEGLQFIQIPFGNPKLHRFIHGNRKHNWKSSGNPYQLYIRCS